MQKESETQLQVKLENILFLVLVVWWCGLSILLDYVVRLFSYPFFYKASGFWSPYNLVCHILDATVYVGNVDDKVSEPLLWELFLQAGPVGK